MTRSIAHLADRPLFRGIAGRPEDLVADDNATEGGAVFHRCALQVNPQHYGGTFRGEGSAVDEGTHAASIVSRAGELGISILAITDHNSSSGVTAFRDAATDSGITIFPGSELSSSEGIHVICIYPPDTEEEQLGRYLGGFGILTPDPSTDLANFTFEQVLAKVREQGGIALAAHATTNKGLFNVLTGQARIQAWRSNDLVAIQIPGSVETLPPNIRPIVENRNPDYRREHPVEEGLAVAVVNAQDVTKPSDLDTPAANCWIKMSEVSIEGLKQAFLDPVSRIRLHGQGNATNLAKHGELVEVGWTGGFLDGVSVPLNPNLNVLVGGRGTGKSTVIESLRYVLGLDPIGTEAQKTHRGIVSHVLRSRTEVTLQVRVYHPRTREYQIERTVPDPPVMRDNNGEVSKLLPTEVVPRVEVFGQGELSKLTSTRLTSNPFADWWSKSWKAVGTPLRPGR